VTPSAGQMPDTPDELLSPELVLVHPELAAAARATDAARSSPRQRWSMRRRRTARVRLRPAASACVVGRRIASARRQQGLTQRRLAAALHLSVWQVDRIERGELDPSAHLTAIAEITGRELDWFQQPANARPAQPHERLAQTAAAGSAHVAGRTFVLGGMTLLVTIRFFTEIVHVLPRAANFVDIPVFLTLGAAALSIRSADHESRRWYRPVGLAAAAFLALAVFSVIVNSGRTEPGPAFVFVYGFLAPLGVYAAVYRLWPSGNARAFTRMIVTLGVIELAVVGLVDLPTFVDTRNPDDVSGTFGTNAYQLVFFLLVFVALLVGMSSLEPRTRLARLAPVLILATFVTILLAQYRSLLVTTVVALVATALLFGGRARALLTVTGAVIAFIIAFQFLAANVPELKLESAASSLARNPGDYASGRLRIVENVSRLYGDSPSAILIGTGPGTYSSRAWQTFANAASTSQSNVAGSYAMRLTGGKPYTTDVSDKYVVPQARFGPIVQGSRAVSSPYSSYTSLLAEVGVFGFAVIAAIYVGAARRAWRMARFALATQARDGSLPALLVATSVAFLTLLQMAFLENWLEVTRLTFISWAMLAVCAKEMDGRGDSWRSGR
jgi:transcriptional regulator with XRE-family HTH domain